MKTSKKAKSTKSAKNPVKRKYTKKVKTPEVVQNPVQLSTGPEITAAQKNHLMVYRDKRTPTELATDTGLSVTQIEVLLASPEFDRKSEMDAGTGIRRFIQRDGMTMMNEAQSHLDDLVHQQNLPSKIDMLEKFKDCILPVEFKTSPKTN